MKKLIQAIRPPRLRYKSIEKLMLMDARVFALAIAIVITLLNSPCSRAQSQAGPKPSFEVASVKISKGCGNTAPGVQLNIPLGPSYQPGGRYYACSALKWIIMEAYQLDPFLPVTGGPSWIDDTFFQIEAKAEGNPDKAQVRLMVQSLLEERFKLRMHTEKRPAVVYLLVVANGGHKLQPAKDAQGNLVTSLPSAEDYQKRWEQMQEGKPTSPAVLALPGTHYSVMKPSGHELIGRAMSMEKLADALFGIVGRRRVVDKTGLTGLYDFKVVYANPYEVSVDAESSAPSIFGSSGFIVAI
jgi:uncharacterized protein (TIGR03435 family)